MSNEKKEAIDLILITGFLGAGKTTFLRRLVSHAERKNSLAVVVNEFSDLPVDAALLNAKEIAPGVEVVELTSGSIFCGCLKPDFIQALLELAKIPIDLIIVEGSGLADPASIGRLVEEASARASRPIAYRGSICLADAASFVEMADTLIALESQAASSRCVLLNKIDLADEEAIVRAEAKIREFSPKARIFRTVHAEADIPTLLEAVTQSDYAGESSNTPESRPGAYVLTTTQPVDWQGLVRFLEAVAPSAYRIKGFLDSTQGRIQVSAVQEQIEVSPAETHEEVRLGLALIAKDTQDLRPLLQEAWERHLGAPLAITPEKPPLSLRFAPWRG